MLRHAAMRVAVRQHSAVRCLTTAAQKRALNKQQLEGSAKATAAKAPDSGSTSPPPAKPPPPSGGNNSVLLGAVAVAAAGAGYYVYSQQQQPEMVKKEIDQPGLVEQELMAKKKTEPVKKEEPAPEKQAEIVPEEPPAVEVLKKTEEQEAPQQVAVVESPKETDGHRVTTIVVPPTVHRPKSTPPPVSHPAHGNRVSMEPKQESSSTLAFSAEAAAQELRSNDSLEASATLQKAHEALRANLDQSLLTDLDSKSTLELKVRVVQLAAEMEERTKWEAVRLKEFLAMKEKETADKYMEILQKQRIEFEGLLARRLLEQEEALTRRANAALQEKENSIQAVVKAAADAQEAEHEEDLKSSRERIQQEESAKHEAEFSNKLASEKASFAKELQGKQVTIQELSNKLSQLDSSLEASKTFESGSQHAHRVSAAAMALAYKMESNKGAAPELAALSMAAGDDGVIASALAAVPDSIKTGVPTLAELQTRFESVKKKARQAVMVPEGWSGLEGQLMGMTFSKLALDRSPDEPVENQNDPDYVLCRAQRYVQLGELDRAVEQLDKLQGQAAFTVSDWKQAAKDRIAVENALKVIKMECALLNESHSGSEESG